jgi:hypothetical protein
VSKVSVNPYSNLFHDTEGAMVHYDDQCYSSFTVACRFQIVLVRWMRLIKKERSIYSRNVECVVVSNEVVTFTYQFYDTYTYRHLETRVCGRVARL